MPENEPVGSSIGVQRGVWADLPAEVALMVAPPVTVTASPHVNTPLSRSRGNMPVGGRRRRAG